MCQSSKDGWNKKNIPDRMHGISQILRKIEIKGNYNLTSGLWNISESLCLKLQNNIM